MSRRFLNLLVFTTGAAVLSIELTASRLLAPYFGTSIFVWANLIGIVLVSLSVGYWFGGKLADRKPELRLLLLIVLTAGVATALVPLVSRAIAGTVLRAVSGFDVALVAGSFLATLILFTVPVLLLGMVSPFAIRLATTDVAKAGNAAGAIFAFGTLGSVVGAFGSAFGTVPNWGSRETFLLSSFLLILISAVGLKKWWPYLFLFVPIAVYALVGGAGLKPLTNIVAERESAYQYLQVVDEGDGTRTLRVNDGIGVQSVYDPNSPRVGKYFDYFALLPYFRPEKRSQTVLNIGHAAGTITRQLDELVRKDFDLTITGVEIDREATELARQYFDLGKQNITVVNADGRVSLERSDKRYDAIIVDAYSQQIYIPFHLSTREFFELTRNHLEPDGIVSININAITRDTPLLQAFLATLAEVFPNVYVQHVSEGYNYFVFASMSSIDFSAFQQAVASSSYSDIGETLPETVERIEHPTGLVFTDNRAPVELMTESMIFRIIGTGQLGELQP